MPLSQEKVQEWVAEFMKATSGGGGGTPTDWKKLQDLMSKRVTVEMPGEPKQKKFEDFQKKGTIYYNSFKNAKRTIPLGGEVIAVLSKKDEVEVIVPEETKFEWNAGSTLAFKQGGSGGFTPTTKAKVFVYHRFTLSAKGECSWYAPLFACSDFMKDEMPYEDEAKEIFQLYANWSEEQPLLSAEDIAVEWPVIGKMDKAGLFALLSSFTDCKRRMMADCSPVAMPLLADKDGRVIYDCIVPAVYSFKWSSSLNDTFKVSFDEGTQVELTSYDCLKVDRTGIVAADYGKVISFAPHFDPSVHIKPV